MPRNSIPSETPAQHALEQHWVSMRHLKHFVDYSETAGFDGSGLLELLGMSRSQLDDADAVIPFRHLERLLACMVGPIQDRPLGLKLASTVQPATFGILGLLTQSSPRLADALALLVRYNGLLSDIGHFHLQRSPGRMHVRWDCDTGSALFRRHAREYVLGSVVVLSRRLLPAPDDFPLAVTFPHDPPVGLVCRQDYQNVLDCPVYFEQPEASVILDSRLLDQPLRHGDPAIRHALEPHADAQLQQRRRDASLTDEAGRLLGAMLSDGHFSMAELARQLGISTRNLQRQLQEENTSYRDVLDAARLARVRVLLDTPHLSLDAIAAHIGLRSRHSVIRWFHRMTGQTPGQYREDSRS